jgi:uracil-DNA glycosylase
MFNAIARFSAPNVFNPWRDPDSLDLAGHPGAQRLRRLRQHFNCQPAFVLIGEAPSYQGCRFSGVPFTSERLLLQGGIPRVTCAQRITSRVRPWSEPSATIVWSTLFDLGIAESVVLWNAFPWHPHQPDEPHSNRRPTDAEARQGSAALKAVLERFRGATVLAVGQVARQALHAVLGADPITVRHPSMGGANEFRTRLAAIVRAHGSERRRS